MDPPGTHDGPEQAEDEFQHSLETRALRAAVRKKASRRRAVLAGATAILVAAAAGYFLFLRRTDASGPRPPCAWGVTARTGRAAW